jgi:hypothetical protein
VAPVTPFDQHDQLTGGGLLAVDRFVHKSTQPPLEVSH